MPENPSNSPDLPLERGRVEEPIQTGERGLEEPLREVTEPRDNDGQKIPDGKRPRVEDTGDLGISFKRQRFEALSDSAVYEWELPKELSSYAIKYFERFVPERKLKDTITENPISTNFIAKPKRLDDHFKEILEDQRRKKDLDADASLERIQTKILQTMGPLSKVWYLIEEALASESLENLDWSGDREAEN